MGKLKIVELVGKEFKPKRHYVDFKTFYDETMFDKNGEIDYYCFSPPENFLTKLSLDKKLSPEDIYYSKIFNEFSWYAYNLIENKHPDGKTNRENFSEKYTLIRKEISDTAEELDGLEKENIEQESVKRIKKLPFFSPFWAKFMTFESRFLKSNFNIKYFDQVKKDVNYYREEFGEDFKRGEYNQYIFENVYELFSEISLKDLFSGE